MEDDEVVAHYVRVDEESPDMRPRLEVALAGAAGPIQRPLHFPHGAPMARPGLEPGA